MSQSATQELISDVTEEALLTSDTPATVVNYKSHMPGLAVEEDRAVGLTVWMEIGDEEMYVQYSEVITANSQEEVIFDSLTPQSNLSQELLHMRVPMSRKFFEDECIEVPAEDVPSHSETDFGEMQMIYDSRLSKTESRGAYSTGQTTEGSLVEFEVSYSDKNIEQKYEVKLTFIIGGESVSYITLHDTDHSNLKNDELVDALDNIGIEFSDAELSQTQLIQKDITAKFRYTNDSWELLLQEDGLIGTVKDMVFTTDTVRMEQTFGRT